MDVVGIFRFNEVLLYYHFTVYMDFKYHDNGVTSLMINDNTSIADNLRLYPLSMGREPR